MNLKLNECSLFARVLVRINFQKKLKLSNISKTLFTYDVVKKSNFFTDEKLYFNSFAIIRPSRLGCLTRALTFDDIICERCLSKFLSFPDMKILLSNKMHLTMFSENNHVPNEAPKEK